MNNDESSKLTRRFALRERGTRLGFCGVITAFLLSGMISRAGDWPQWRGPTRNGCAPAGAPDVTSLPKELKPVWKVSIGAGFSSPIVAGDNLVYLDEQDGKEVVHLLK